MLDLLHSVGGFLIAIGVLVAFHEFGHYWVARRCGVRVLRFSLGFGRPLFKRTARDGVEWAIGAIPLGGYVKMLDEREQEVPPGQRHLAFNNASVWRRIAIVAAGPLFNFALAILLYWVIFVIGVEGMRPVLDTPPAGSVAAHAGLKAGETVQTLDGTPIDTWTQLRTDLLDRVLEGGSLRLDLRDAQGALRSVTLDLAGVSVDPEKVFDALGLVPYAPPIPPVLEQIMPGEAAAAAGFQIGDELLSHDGIAIESWQQWAAWVRAHPGEVSQVEVRRDGQTQRLTVIIGGAGESEAQGRFGAAVANPGDLWQDLRAVRRLDVLSAWPAAVGETWNMASLTVRMLWRMVTGDVSMRNISGPIQIAQVAGYTAQVGLVSFLSFLAIVSVSLGVLNLLPVPVLDGGHLLYYAVEAVKGSPLSERVQAAGQRLGMSLLMLLMGLAFYNDLSRLFG